MKQRPIKGIYAVEVESLNLAYVGQSQNIKKRFDGHKSALRRGNHTSIRLQDAFNAGHKPKYRVILEVSTDNLAELESKACKEYLARGWDLCNHIISDKIALVQVPEEHSNTIRRLSYLLDRQLIDPDKINEFLDIQPSRIPQPPKPTPDKSKKAKIKSANPLNRIKKYRVKQERLYQNWRVWEYGTSVLFVSSEAMLFRLKAKWFELYKEKLDRTTVYYLCLIRIYLAVTQQEYFSAKGLVSWAIERELLAKSYLNNIHMAQYFYPRLFNTQFMNPVDKVHMCYSLTQRAKFFFSLFDEFIKPFFGGKGEWKEKGYISSVFDTQEQPSTIPPKKRAKKSTFDREMEDPKFKEDFDKEYGRQTLG